jgi:hypothetical protein
MGSPPAHQCGQARPLFTVRAAIPLWIRVKPIEKENTDHVVGADYVRDDVAQVTRGELKDVAIALGTDDKSLLDHRYHPEAL